MARRKENPRIVTYNKLIKIGKSREKDILNLKLEDLKMITDDPDFLNIIYLKECVKNHNSLEYFNYSNKNEGEGEK